MGISWINIEKPPWRQTQYNNSGHMLWQNEHMQCGYASTETVVIHAKMAMLSSGLIHIHLLFLLFSLGGNQSDGCNSSCRW